ncbi:MAG: hypothetical protein H7Z17_19190 [Fuerstia sp.]|nr:hypothetical protein [Fuerstiella sp.]
MLWLARISNVSIVRRRASLRVVPHVSICPLVRSGLPDPVLDFLRFVVDAEPAAFAGRRHGVRTVCCCQASGAASAHRYENQRSRLKPVLQQTQQVEAMRTLIIFVFILITPLIIAASGWSPDEPKAASPDAPSAILSKAETNREKVVSGLSTLSFLVGDWKGVAQPKRGSNSGAWSEKAHTVWHFDEKIPCLLLKLEPGEKSTSIFFATASETGRPIIELHQPEKPSIALEMTEPGKSPASDAAVQTDKSAPDHWVFESVVEPGNPRLRLTVRKINDIRITLLFEESTGAEAAFRRQYEIGMTRAGERLAKGNTGERECIVTGGLGTISVSHGGKTYYVCCEGCQQAFEADPEGTLTAYRERLKQKSQ